MISHPSNPLLTIIENTLTKQYEKSVGLKFSTLPIADSDKKKITDFILDSYKTEPNDWETVSNIAVSLLDCYLDIEPISDDNHKSWKAGDVFGKVVGVNEPNTVNDRLKRFNQRYTK